jgi:hypothetical protein
VYAVTNDAATNTPTASALVFRAAALQRKEIEVIGEKAKTLRERAQWFESGHSSVRERTANVRIAPLDPMVVLESRF